MQWLTKLIQPARRRLQAVYERHVDMREGRVLIGKDLQGNKYYQYYSWYGLETRREVRFVDPRNIDI
jgi:hypothetical protein